MIQEIECKLKTYLRQNLEGRKCILIIGSMGSGKSTFTKFLSGYTFQSSEGQDGQLTLVQNSAPDQQLLLPFHQKSQSFDLELRLFPFQDENVVFIDMPSFPFEYPEGLPNQKIAQQFVFSSLVWSFVTAISKEVNICLVIPIDKVINDDDERLIKFIIAWQKSVCNESKQQIKQCINIVLSKVTYKEEDTEELIKYLNSIIENGKVDNSNNTFNELIENGRIYCFFNQESQDNDASSFKNELFQKVQYFDQNSHQLFSEQFIESAFMQNIGDFGEQLLKQIEKYFDLNSQVVVKKINYTIQEASSLISLLCVSKLAASFNFPKPFLELKTKLLLKYHCSQQLKTIFDETNSFSQVASSQQGWANKTVQFYDMVCKLNVQKIGTVNFMDFTKIILEQLFTVLNIKQQSKNNFKRFIQSCLCYCSIIDTFGSKFEFAGQATEAQSKLKKFAHENKKKMLSLVRSSISIFVQSLHLQQSITQQTPFLKKLKEISAQELDKQEEESDHQEDANASSSRWYYSLQETQNPYNTFVEKVKKVSLPKQYSTDLKQKSLLKDLFFDIQTKKETRKQSIRKLGEKFLYFGCCEEALFVFMKLEDPYLLYREITKNIFDESPMKMFQMISYKFLTTTFIPYLEERCVLYSEYLEAQQYLYCLHFCYDFLAENNVNNSDQYESLMKLCNQIRVPCKDGQVSTENRVDLIEQSNSYDIKLLSESQLAKGEIIALLETKQKWFINNRIVLSQIQQIL